MTIRTAVVLLFTFLTTSSTFAQGTLKGHAVAADGGVLPGVDIVASNGAVQERRVTDASGNYEFAKLPTGSYTVVASLNGFVTKKREDGGTAGTIQKGVLA